MDKFIQNGQILSYDLDLKQHWRPDRLFDVLQQSATHHAEALNLGYGELIKNNLAWVLTRVRVELLQHPGLNDRYTLETWPGTFSGVLCPRYYLVKNEQGQTAIKASSIWVVIHLLTRQMVKPSAYNIAFPSLKFQPDSIELPAKITVSQPFSLSYSSSRTVCYSDTDLNGHMNNVKYINWVLDALSSSWHRQHDMRVLQLNYVKELKIGTNVQMNVYEYGDSVLVQGISDGQIYFTGQILC